MAVQLDCPSCGTLLKVRRGVVSVTCQYCGISVMVPEYMAGSQGVVPSNALGKSCARAILIFVAVLILLVIGVGVFIFQTVGGAKDGVVELSALVSAPYEPTSKKN